MHLVIDDERGYNDNQTNHVFDFEDIGFNPGSVYAINTTLRVSNPVLQPEVLFTIEMPSYINYNTLSTGCGYSRMRFKGDSGI